MCVYVHGAVVNYYDVFLVSVPGRHVQIMRRCGLEQIFCSNPVPTSDSGKSIPRYLVAQPAFFKPDETK